MAKVSVIIPCYKSGSYIDKCIAALERQTYKDFDVIMVDDCSPDDTWSVITRLSDVSNVQIKCMKNEVNSGPAKSRHNGILVSGSDYIAFCDSDDWYEDVFLEKMIERAEKNDADIVFCNTQKVLSNGKLVKGDIIGEVSENISVSEALSFGFDSMCAMMIKRDIVLNTPFPDIRNGEDMAMIPLMIMKSGKFGAVRECLYNYYCRQGSLSLTVNEKVIKSLEESYDFIYQNRESVFEKEIEFIGIKNVVYGALLNLFKISYDIKWASEILNRFEEKYPNWANNFYLETLSIYKRVFVVFAKKRFFIMTKILSAIHKLITR